MSDEHDDDENGAVAPTIANLENRRLLAVLGDMKLAAHEHNRKLDLLYDTLRGMPHVAPPAFAPMLLEAQEEHLRRVGETVENLRDIVKGTAS